MSYFVFITYLYQTIEFLGAKTALGIFIFPIVACTIFANNYYIECSSLNFIAYEALFWWWSHLVFSSALTGRDRGELGWGGRCYSRHFISKDIKDQSSCVICPANRAECQNLILELKCRSLTLNVVFLPVIFFTIWMQLIAPDLGALRCIILAVPTIFLRQGKVLRLVGFGGLLLWGFLLIPPPFVIRCGLSW